MAIHLTEAEALRLGIIAPEALAPAPTPLFAAAVMAEDAAPPKPLEAHETGSETPHFTPSASTQAYALLRAALALSSARYGAPAVARVSGGYGIRIGDSLAVGVDITEPLCTVVSQHVKVRGKWRTLETLRLAKLTPHELLSLFVTGKD